MTEGYLLVAIGKNYIDECYNLSLTLRKNKDFRPISIIINEEDREYALSKNIFDHILKFDTKSKLFDDCNTSFEKYGVYSKITLDKYLPYDKNIYLDSDVLCIYDTQEVWNIFNKSNQSVQAIGFEKDPSWHFGKLENVSKKYGKNVPHTHSGILYVLKSQETYDFFEYCRETFYKHDEYGCSREFRGGIADEILFAISFSKFNYLPHDNLESQIMTFNLPYDCDIPSRIQTVKYPMIRILNNNIAFVHMMDKQYGYAYKNIFNKILNMDNI
jgi:lipopolysaccharide biosynthesis glycosyltransferase